MKIKYGSQEMGLDDPRAEILRQSVKSGKTAESIDTDVDQFFKAVDFDSLFRRNISLSDIAEHANRLLRERGKFVYLDRTPSGCGKFHFSWTEGGRMTHTALLVNDQLIQKIDPTIRDLKLEGMSAVQVYFLKMFYESQTGKRAEHILTEEHKGSHIELNDWEKIGRDLAKESASGDLSSFIERARQLAKTSSLSTKKLDTFEPGQLTHDCTCGTTKARHCPVHNER